MRNPDGPLRFGIAGVAEINKRLIPALQKASKYGVELRAIASRDLGQARHAASEAGIPVAHGSYDALMDDPDIDAVYLPLPNHLHDEWTRKAADRGKHVLCEKPLCPTAAEAEALVAYCQGKGVKLLDGFMWPHHPRSQRIRNLLASGKLGEVRHISGAFTFPMDLDSGNYRLDPTKGGGSLLDVGCYPVYAIRYYFGAEPVRAFATARMFNGVDVEMSGQVWLADGRVGQFECAFTQPVRQWFEIAGTKGRVVVPHMWSPPEERASFLVYQGEGEHIPGKEEVIRGHDQINCMLLAFLSLVQGEETPWYDPLEPVKTLRVLDALARSVREGVPVDV